MMLRLLTVALKAEPDVVFARQRARQLAGLLGFDRQDQTRIATAVSEVARNAIEYAKGGVIDFSLTGSTPPQLFDITITDKGPGIPHLQSVLAGEHRSSTGMGVGLFGARRLMDQFAIESTAGEGTSVTLKKLLPAKAPLVRKEDLGPITDQLVAQDSDNPMDELRRQNQELMFSLAEVERQRKDLATLNDELQDTNRGVVALYAELDEKAEHLRRADELKLRFLSNMSHEFRTPLNSILALSGLLLNRVDGELTPEQERQIGFVRKAAESLSELVNDLLDLAKVEAGKIEVRPIEFAVSDLFGALRGMLRPLLVSERVNLVFEDVASVPHMFSDEGKVSQILRNLISNALKFTEHGEVRVSAAVSDDEQHVTFTVGDTGIGIAPEHQDVIFRAFSQLDSPLQRKVKGTGLGLPLSKRLCELLGGAIKVESRPGEGSVFSFTLPLHYGAVEPEPTIAPDAATGSAEDARIPVLAVEDNAADMMVYESLLRRSPYRLIGVKTVRDAKKMLAEAKPRVVILDLLLQGEDSWRFLAELKREPDTRRIPVLVVTTVEDKAKALALGANAYGLKPVGRNWLLGKLNELIEDTKAKRILLIDDDEASRYIVRRCLADQPYLLREAATGEAGLACAAEEEPDLVLLDLKLPGISGFEVLQRLRNDPRTSRVPVVVVTSAKLNDPELANLSAAERVIAKNTLSQEALGPTLRELIDAGA